jgi:hypothetical protein
VGDGSGNMWGNPVGFGCVALERDTMERKVFWGAMNDGTVTTAELLAYIAPLTWYAGKVADARKGDDAKMGLRQVHIITDSQHLQGRGEGGGAFPRQGIILNWHWLPAYHEKPDIAAELNEYVDHVSKEARLLVKGFDMVDTLGRKGLDPYKRNPWE